MVDGSIPREEWRALQEFEREFERELEAALTEEKANCATIKDRLMPVIERYVEGRTDRARQFANITTLPKISKLRGWRESGQI